MSIDKKILLVEDNAIIALSHKISLEKYGYNVKTSNTGEKALEDFKKNKDINLILMDIDLGKGIDGIETAILILKEREIPIVFLSNHIESKIVEKTEQITSYGYVVKNSGITVLDASIKMAFKLFNANKKITESKGLYLALINSTDDLIWSIDKNLNLITSNIAFFERTNLKPGDNVIEKSNYSDEIKELWKCFYKDVLSGRTIRKDLHIPETDKFPSYWLELNLNPIVFDSEIIGVACFSSSISERKHAEDALISSEERYRMITNSANDAIITTSSNGLILDWNNGAEKIFGYSKEEINGENLTILMPKKFVEEHNNGIKRMATGGERHVINQNKTVELTGLHKNGNEFQIELSLTELLTSTGKLFTGIIRDISERKKAEEKIKFLLEEKELRLKEVHHRIKNNMATIKSLLSLQIETLTDPISISALKDAGSRIQSMMVIYDKLYLSLNVESLPVSSYIPSLVDEILANFPNSKMVKVQKRFDDFVLNVNKIQPVGIIINELLTNIMKYAFIGKEEGLISISMLLKGNHVSIIVEDDGSGIPKTTDFDEPIGFGHTLIKMLTEQIDGTIRIESAFGTKITLEFDR